MSLKIYTDGGSRGNPGIAGGGVYITLDNQAILSQSLCLGKKTNNEAEYLSFLAALLWLKRMAKKQDQSFTQVKMLLDSKLVVEQINKNWKIKEPRLAVFAAKCWEIMENLPYSIKVEHIKRELNSQADELANIAMDLANQL